MLDIIRITGEVLLLALNVLIMAKTTVFKNDSLFCRILLFGGSGLIITSFFVCTYLNVLPELSCFFLCYVLPEMLLFLLLSKYRDFRFLVSFCMVNTLLLILTFFARAAWLWSKSDTIETTGTSVLCAIMCLIYFLCKEYFKDFRDLMSYMRDGWGMMALSSVMIYVLFVFTAAYPKPIVDRIIYIPVFLVLSATIITVYAVFIKNIFQKKTLYDLNNRFVAEQNWHSIAHKDALTGMGNRLAYIERINELENNADRDTEVFMVVLDINNFKEINDTKGHFFGDEVLKKSACAIWSAFCEESCTSFRIGGDEFAVIAQGVSRAELDNKLCELRKHAVFDDLRGTFSIGFAKVDFSVENAMEAAFTEADKAMYDDKLRIKGTVRNRTAVFA